MKNQQTCRRRKGTGLLAAAVFCLLLSSCNFGTGDDTSTVQQRPDIEPSGSINDVQVKDKASVYADDDDDSIVTMYLTVRRGNAADNTDHSWSEVNGNSTYYYDEKGIPRYGVEGILQVGDESGPSPDQIGYGLNVPNATVQVRGKTSSRAEQKSFKIKIKSGAGSWRNQKTIALNKHPYDSTRIRNKLSYDLIKTVPGMIGLRTQFVHLYVKDQTGNDATGAKFVDYGLYTQVEQPNKRFLRNHGLDEYGQLYKASMFEFFRYPDALKLADDPKYDLSAFEEVLEVKGNDDHQKLLTMLDDLNNYSLPTEEVFAKYFDEENYFTWLAFQMLTGNTDTTSQNFLLYSPQNSQKWYFISWDNDGAWGSGEDRLFKGLSGYNYEKGISNYWGSVLHKRVLKSPELRKKLDNKIQEIRKLVSESVVAAKVKEYQKVTQPYLYAMPDVMYDVYDVKGYEQVLNTLGQEVEINYQMYLTSLERPLPFFLDTITVEKDAVRFQWDVSFDFDNEALTYTFELARDYTFKTTLNKQENLKLPQAQTGKLAPGQYFMRVSVKNASGQTQTAQEYYEDQNGVRHYGVRCFYILPDGTLGEG
ncbi:CotH kinase family protein [Anaeromassilibacillus sp. SJQ-5]